ncbi:hypothetical protein SDC9_167369 [bioreactor metagenome]|uniref:Uncharacterized protein n=1 Tax=bioreactor metagenome TaxID=1076179 RepID=A0A645G7U0_9ZZZZ
MTGINLFFPVAFRVYPQKYLSVSMTKGLTHDKSTKPQKQVR